LILDTIKFTSTIQKTAQHKDANTRLANLLYSETILMKKINHALEKDKVPFDHPVIKETLIEIRESFERTMHDYYQITTEDMKNEIMITKELRFQREKLKEELIESRKNLSNRS